MQHWTMIKVYWQEMQTSKQMDCFYNSTSTLISWNTRYTDDKHTVLMLYHTEKWFLSEESDVSGWTPYLVILLLSFILLLCPFTNESHGFLCTRCVPIAALPTRQQLEAVSQTCREKLAPQWFLFSPTSLCVRGWVCVCAYYESGVWPCFILNETLHHCKTHTPHTLDSVCTLWTLGLSLWGPVSSHKSQDIFATLWHFVKTVKGLS